MIFWVVVFFSTFLLSYILTRYLRVYALKINCMDIPNERSSHHVPTPRGGGMAFVLSFITALLVVMFFNESPLYLGQALLILGLGVAALGWCDDRYQLSAILRLGFQVLLATCALYLLGFFHHEVLKPGVFVQGFLGVFYLVWMINMFNFMDGIDGYASMEAAFLATAIFLGSFATVTPEVNPLMSSLLAAVLGFAFWNFPVAKIFMGDAGSGFLGGILGLISVYIALYQPKFIPCWFILTALFMSDAVYTLLLRIARKERFWMAHRQHAYQHASRQLKSHVRVTVLGLIINLGWLLPLAWLTYKGNLSACLGLSLAFGPLMVLMLYFRAGRPEGLN